MRYAQIRKMDISNGEGVGISLFVQGCHFHCKDCFNQETWDFEGGKKWTLETQREFLNLADKPYIKRISILGGEPLADENYRAIMDLLLAIELRFGNTKSVWLYTGYTWEELQSSGDLLDKREKHKAAMRSTTAFLANVLVDGRFETDKKDLALAFRGSRNQRIIDVQKSLDQNCIVLWEGSDDRT